MEPGFSKRLDHQVIFEIVEPASKVLDLGCGSGDLLDRLKQEKGVKAQGIEISEKAIYQCVEKGLSVVHSDLDSGLPDYPDDSFDFVILNQSLQESKNVDLILKEALRVGKKVIIGFPNFAYYRSRLMLFFRGTAPVNKALPYRWFNSPNLHFLSVKDFRQFCSERQIRILENHYLGERRKLCYWPNFFALNAIFVLTRAAGSNP